MSKKNKKAKKQFFLGFAYAAAAVNIIYIYIEFKIDLQFQSRLVLLSQTGLCFSVFAVLYICIMINNP